MPELRRAGRSIYYETHGSGPALLLSHGFSATSQMWIGQISELSKRHQLILWDMCGHGRSESPEDACLYSEAHTVADMRALLDHLGHPSAIIGGLSLGGFMSLAFHVAHPEYVRALLVFDTGPGFKNDQAREAWNESARATGDSLDQQGLAALQSMSVEMAEAQHKSAFGLAMAARHMLTQVDDRAIQSLPEIRVPTLVLVGAEDEPFIGATNYMAHKIPGATKVIIEGAGHASNIDRRRAFNDAVVEFLSQRDL